MHSMARRLPPPVMEAVWAELHSLSLSASLRDIRRAGPGHLEDLPDLIDDRTVWSSSDTRRVVEVYGYGRVTQVLGACVSHDEP